jgi:pyrroloquinoline quinone biosynthesis protein E
LSPESGAAPAEHRPYTLVAELTYRCPLRCPYCSNLEALIEAARALDLYTNLSTSGIPLTRERLARLRTLGLDSVQLSIQDVTAERKLEVARWVKELGFPLTVNTVLHRDNLDHVGEIVALAERLSADRLELANTQYLGWALLNRGRSFR